MVGALAVALVLPTFVPLGGAAFVFAVPAVAVGSVLLGWHRTGNEGRDVADRIMAAAATFAGEPASPDGDQVGWGAAMRAELATITIPRERRRFAVGAAVALLGRPRSLRSLLVAAAVAVAFGGGLLAVSRAGMGGDGLASVTLLLPPVLLFALAHLCSRSTRSLRFGLETGVVAVLTTLVAVAVVYGVEAVHWYHIAPDVSVLDGDHVDLDSPRAAVLDVLNPILLLVHLVFWSPWPVLGALVGAQRVRRAPQAATG
jgi:hypothetical protein